MPAEFSSIRSQLAAGPYAVAAGWALVDRGRGAELLRDACLIVRDGAFAEVGAGDPPDGLPLLDARAHLVLPGLISAHTHVAAGLPTRGTIESGRPYMRPLELMEQLAPDEIDTLTAANLAEMLRSGCTAQFEMSLSRPQADSYVRVAGRWGVRGWPAIMVPATDRLAHVWFRDSDSVLTDSVPQTVAETGANLAFAHALADRGDPLLLPMMAAHATDTQTPETLAALRRALQDLDAPLHIHIAQRASERDTVHRLWGCSPVRLLEREGLLEGPVFGAHMTAVDWAADGPLLRDRGVVYVHCPSAGGAGVSSQPYPEALAAGVASAIGLDTHSNDAVENVKLAVIKGRVRAAALASCDCTDVRAPTIAEAVDSATRIPADGLGRADLGRIAPGARADFTAIDITGPLVGDAALPPEPLHHLLYANGTAVSHVAVDGRLKLLHGRFLPEDEALLRARAARIMNRLWESLAAEDWFAART